MSMKWIEITSEVYFGLYDRYQANFSVFGAYTNLENNSRFNAGVLTEWGFAEDEEPLIKCVGKPESQVNVGCMTDWPKKYYLNVLTNDGIVV